MTVVVAVVVVVVAVTVEMQTVVAKSLVEEVVDLFLLG